jgi:hypothetical protein
MKHDLFGPVPRRPPLVRMRAIDHGEAPAKMPEWKTANGARFRCWRCHHDAGWLFNLSNTEIRIGIPCPKCNEGRL